MRHKEFWIALSVGALAGAVAALLYAPRSGASTRRKIKRGVEDLSESLQESAEYLRDQAEKLGKEAQKLLDYSKDQMDSLADVTGVAKLGSKTVKAVSRLM